MVEWTLPCTRGKHELECHGHVENDLALGGLIRLRLLRGSDTSSSPHQGLRCNLMTNKASALTVVYWYTMGKESVHG